MITPSFGLTATERVLPKLPLDFTTASLDSRITFTRTTGASNPATYINSSGYVTAATNNEPRFDYDPATLACKGLLIEESRTNLLKYSAEFNNAIWGKSAAASVVSNSVTGPDNTLSGDTLVFTAGAATVNQEVIVTSGATYTFSVWIRCDSGTVSVNIGSINVGVYETKTVTTTWQRFTVTQAASAATRYPAIQSTGASTIYAWGAQLEAGAFATSYIPTTSAALTRNADVATMTGTNFSDWFNASEGSFVGWAIPMTTNSTVRSPVCTISNGTASNIMTFGQATVAAGGTTLSYYVADGAVEQAYLTASGQAAANTLYKVSMSYKANSFNASFKGNTPVSDTSGTVPIVDQLVLGSGVSKLGNSWISKLFYYPMLTNAELQAFAK